MKEHIKELKEALAAAQEAANRTSLSREPPQLPVRPPMPATEDYFQAGVVLPGSNERTVPDLPIRQPVAVGSPPTTHLMPSPPPTSAGSSPAQSPRQNLSPMGSPRSPGVNGFKTIHGNHRPDGSLGGYRKDVSIRRMTSHNTFYANSMRKGSYGGSTSDPSSPHSPNGPKSESREASIEERSELEVTGASDKQPFKTPDGRTYRVV